MWFIISIQPLTTHLFLGLFWIYELISYIQNKIFVQRHNVADKAHIVKFTGTITQLNSGSYMHKLTNKWVILL